ncbi:MAG: FHA domain-containing protein [Planctomycetes bacterium]|nr:FHA domain-containing protein [Planctomycetota bacterium]
MPKLIVKSGGTGREWPLAKETFSIGRTPENDLEVKDSLISRRHSSIVRKGERYVLYDLGSSNGTFVNRAKVEMKMLEDGDVIRIGNTEITFADDALGGLTPPSRPEPGAPAADPLAGGRYIVQHVDDIAESYSINLSSKLSQGLSLRDVRRDVADKDKAAKDSKMFFILFTVGEEIKKVEKIDEMLATSMKLIFDVINADRGAMLLFDAHRNLVPRLAYQQGQGIISADHLALSGTIIHQVVSEKVSIITSDARQDPRFMQGQSIVQFNIRSALCVPLWEEKNVYGAIYLDNLALTYAFTKDDLDLLTGIANLIAARIRQEELNERLRREEVRRANLAKYLSPDVVEVYLSRGGDIGLEVIEREVSVVFADVEGSTKLAEAVGPKKVAEILNEFFLMATDAIFEHKGSVNKFIGDEVMAIYNAPLDQPDHALNAVKSAIKLLKELERHNREHPDRTFSVRIGINSGPAVAGNVGTPTRMEYTVLGDTVNVASRLCKLTPLTNRIIIGETTYSKIKGHLRVKEMGETTIRGREKVVRAYEVIP